jgi:hypothetical protein
MPSRLMVEIQAIGRGTTHDLNGLNGNPWSFFAGSKNIDDLSWCGGEMG